MGICANLCVRMHVCECMSACACVLVLASECICVYAHAMKCECGPKYNVFIINYNRERSK